MRRMRVSALVLAGSSIAVSAGLMAGCGGTNVGPGFALSDGGSSQSDATVRPPTVDGGKPAPGGDGGVHVQPGQTDSGAPPPPPPPQSDSGIPCPSGLTCINSCSGGGTTTITGKVYDPAGKNPLYNAAVYVPATPLAPLPRGVLTGASACSCDALFTSGALANATTAEDGTFKMEGVPSGSSVPLVIQIGKWRRLYHISVTACQDNPQPDKSLAFLGTIPAGDTDDSMPDIAVSTGQADTLECLMTRIGIPGKEYVAGSSTAGHIHVFAGGDNGSSGSGTGAGGNESPGFPGAPTSWTALWDKQSDMMPYDVVLLSCEGDETFNAKPDVLEQYLNAGGRAFGSHFHYAWFGGPLQNSGTTPSPTPPSDWGANLATWSPSLSTSPSGSATVVQTLTGSAKPFPKGVSLEKWLGVVGALGIESASPGQVPIFYEQTDIGPANKAQAWLTDQGYTEYISFDTPVNAVNPDGGAPPYCGRAVFSDLHVNADTNFTSDSNPPPTGCGVHDLAPQEKVLEFMLFDLSSCVLPDTVAVPVDAGFPPPAPPPQ